MAHELLIKDGQAAMFYVGGEPWHGLGQRLDKPATAEQAIRAAHLDWAVTKVPLFVAAPTRMHLLPQKYAVMRADTIGAPDSPALGIVGEQYEVLQNRDAFRFFDAIVGEGAAIYHTAGALGHGERVWILAKLEGDIGVANVDAVGKYLLLSNSHDGRSAIQVKFTPIRVVCHNTLTQALATGFTFTARHDRGVEVGLQNVREAMGLVTRRFDRLAREFDELAAIRLDGADLERFLKKVFPDPADQDDERAWERVDASRHWARYLFEHGRGNDKPGVSGTLWAAYNAVAELVDHCHASPVGPRAAANRARTRGAAARQHPPGAASADRHLDSCWFGSGYRTKVRAWNAAVEMARARLVSVVQGAPSA